MSTRGAICFVIDGTEKITYNHSDSYPDWLGVRFLKWLKDADLEQVAQQVRDLRVVNDDIKPTAEDIDRLAPFTNLGVSSSSTDEWYCLLRETQGDLVAILNAGYIEDGSQFPLDSLFCEWAYCLDLDRAAFEVYKGFQEQPHSEGRFADRPVKADSRGKTWYPIKLVAQWNLERLPTEEEFLAIDKEDEE